MSKLLKVSFVALFMAQSWSALALFSDYRFGVTPRWVKDCENLEDSGNLDRLRGMNYCNSKGFMGYRDDLDYYSTFNSDGSYSFRFINSVHVVVTDVALDRRAPDYGSCTSEMCYRAYVYINGDENSGDLVATWATTPGRPWYDGSGGNYTPESLYVYQTSPKKNQNSKGDFLLQRDGEMGLAGDVTNKIPGYFVMDHYRNSDNEDMAWATFYHFGIAFHSAKYVNGDVGSHGCTRLKHIEAKKMNFLARHVGRRFSVETRYTERKRLSRSERKSVISLR